MLVTISPAKSLDLTPVDHTPTQPAFQADAVRLAKTMRGQTLGQLRDLMGLSGDLARLNRDRFKDFRDAPTPDAVKPAALIFNGDARALRRGPRPDLLQCATRAAGRGCKIRCAIFYFAGAI